MPKIRPVIESTECLHKGFCSLYREQLLLPNGHTQTYYSVKTKPLAALVVATTPQGEYILVKEYRHAVDRELIGLPGGFIEEGEEPIKAAKRELLEETGYLAEEIYQIGESFPLPGLLTQQVLFFHAKAAQLVTAPHLDTGEMLETLIMLPSQLHRAIREGASIDSALCAGLFFYQSFNPCPPLHQRRSLEER